MIASEITIPAALRSGDTVALVSPSSKVKHEYIDDAAARLRSWGYDVRIGAHAYGAHGNFAGTPAERLADLHDALADPSVKAILCTRGGYGAVHLLESLPPEVIRCNAKWLIGFSDISALHAAEEAESQESTCYLRAVLEGNMPCYTTPSHWLNRAGEVRARVVGGNLAVLTGLLRTPYDIFQEDTILFIEDVGERTYKVERMLYNLELCGVLPRLAGLVVGRFTDYNEDPGMCMTLYEAVWARVARYSYPVCFDFPVGHVPQNHPMIEGAVATLTVAPQGVTLQF